MATYKNLNDLALVVAKKIETYLAERKIIIEYDMETEIADIVYHHTQRFINELGTK